MGSKTDGHSICIEQQSPHELLFGLQPRNALQNKIILALENEADGPDLNIEEIRNEALQNIEKEQEKQKQSFDRKYKYIQAKKTMSRTTSP